MQNNAKSNDVFEKICKKAISLQTFHTNLHAAY